VKHSYIDRFSEIGSPIARLDPRIKITAFLSLIVFTVVTRGSSRQEFCLQGALALVLVLVSKVPLGFIFKKSLVVIPFVAVVSVFNIVAGNQIIETFLATLSKSLISVVYLILLVATTRFPDLMKAFERLKCPQLITTILSFMYRYVFVIEDELMTMKMAKESRSFGGSALFHAKVFSNILGSLFIRSYERAEEIYLAMCARGFDGDIRTLGEFKLRMADAVFLFTVALVMLSIRFAGVAR
jgi:cobalt/nickel transport system permease protein